MPELTKSGKEELALALILWKDFKCQGKYDTKLTLQMLEFANHLNISKELDTMMSKLPPMMIVPR